MKWFSWPDWMEKKKVYSELGLALNCFANGDYEGFLNEFHRVWWMRENPGWRGTVIVKWLPDLYFRFIGLANLGLAFDLYLLVTQLKVNPRSHDAVDVSSLSSLLARMIAVRSRITSSSSGNLRMLFFPEHQQNQTDPKRPFVVDPLPTLWQTPPSEAKKTVGTDEKKNVEPKVVVEEKLVGTTDWNMVSSMYLAEWTKLFMSGSMVRQSGVTRERLFQLAIWLERLRSQDSMTAPLFLHYLDMTCSGTPSAIFVDVVDPDSRYDRSIHLFMRTMRTFLLQDIGHRIYVLFYWLVIARCVDPSSKRTVHHHSANLEQFTDLLAYASPVLDLTKNIKQLLSSHANCQTSHEKVTPIIKWDGPGLPDVEHCHDSFVAMDWSHPLGKEWIASMRSKFDAVSSSSSSLKKAKLIDSDQQSLQTHLDSLDVLAMKECDREMKKARDEPAVGSEVIAPFPHIGWGDFWKASIDVESRVWVGPFHTQLEMHKLMVGRALFRARKLKEWKLHVLDVRLVHQKKDAFWLRYEGLPINADDIRRNMNLTRAQTLDYRQLNLAHVTNVYSAMMNTPPTGVSARHPYGAVQLAALQIARAILGVIECNLRKDTIAYNALSALGLTIVPTAMFHQRSAHSYKASLSTLQKVAKEKKINKSSSATTPPKPPSKWLIGLFGRRGANVVVERAIGRTSHTSNAVDVKTDNKKIDDPLAALTEEDVRDADTGAVLFGKSINQKNAMASALRANVHNVPFMLEVRSRLLPFFDALKKERELPHLRASLDAIHKIIPLALAPDIIHAFHLDPSPNT